QCANALNNQLNPQQILINSIINSPQAERWRLRTQGLLENGDQLNTFEFAAAWAYQLADLVTIFGASSTQDALNHQRDVCTVDDDYSSAECTSAAIWTFANGLFVSADIIEVANFVKLGSGVLDNIADDAFRLIDQPLT